jgi:hypothetical protein
MEAFVTYSCIFLLVSVSLFLRFYSCDLIAAAMLVLIEVQSYIEKSFGKPLAAKGLYIFLVETVFN